MTMLNKITYAVQPYRAGSKERKSLAIVLAAKVTKECNINPSTICAVNIEHKKRITLKMMDPSCEKDVMSTGLSFPPINNKILPEAH